MRQNICAEHDPNCDHELDHRPATGFDPDEAFANPVAYLGRLGIAAELVDSVDGLASAA